MAKSVLLACFAAVQPEISEVSQSREWDYKKKGEFGQK